MQFLIFESSYLIRQGLVLLIDGMERCELSDEFGDVSQFQTAIINHRPHIVILGMNLISSIPEKIIKKIKKEYKSVFIGINTKDSGIESAFIDQTFDYADDKQQIIDTINQFIIAIKKEKPLKKQDNELSVREKGIVVMVAKGLTNKEISSQLFLSVHTVITHRKNIVRKLGIKSASGLTVYAILNKLIEMKDLY